MSAERAASRNLKSAQKLWRRRVRILPIAFLLLVGAAALGMHLRGYVEGIKPRLDVSQFLGVRDGAHELSRSLAKRTQRPIPTHDLAFLEPALRPKAVVSTSLPDAAGTAYTNRQADPPPVPRLEGIMFSETEESLAVFDNKAAEKGDKVGGWRVVLIEPERVRIVDDESGIVKVVVLYEKKATDDGMTLVEVIVAIVILAILAIGGASAAHMSRRTIIVQRNRRVALGLAHERLERLRAIHYNVLAPSTLDYTSYYVSDDGSGSLVIQASDPGETMQLHGLDVPIETRLQYSDADGGTVSFDGLMISVAVGYHGDGSDRVELETFYADSGDYE